LAPEWLELSIRAVLFDLDETLFDRTGSLHAFLKDQHARFLDRVGDVDHVTWTRHFLALDKRGTVPKSVVYLRLLLAFEGDTGAADILHTDYRQQLSNHAVPVAGMTDTLSKLRKLGVRLGIVTNGETDHQTRNIRALGLTKLANAILVSQEEGVRKPDKAIFLRAAQRLGVEPGDCLFVGDNPIADVLGAHACGMKTAWLTNRSKWPGELSPQPGAIISTLDEVLPLAAANQSLAASVSRTEVT
jgi:putative hydrolase of the HAD superfamily